MTLPAPRPLPLKAGTVIRALSPRGIYWKNSIARTDALYSSSKDLVFTAVHFDDKWADKAEHFSDLDFLKIDEVRFLAALTIPVPFSGGIHSFHPLREELVLDEQPDLADPNVQHRLSALVRNADRKHFRDDYVLLPPVWGGTHPYDFSSSQIREALVNRAFESIDRNDHLLVRGLHTLCRSSMLSLYDVFLQEATYALYVSLDASFQIVRRKLEQEGIENPTAADAGDWLARIEGVEPDGYRYFGDYYVDRIRAMHPASSPFPLTPLAADDFYDLFEGLRSAYNILIFGGVVERDFA